MTDQDTFVATEEQIVTESNDSMKELIGELRLPDKKQAKEEDYAEDDIDEETGKPKPTPTEPPKKEKDMSKGVAGAISRASLKSADMLMQLFAKLLRGEDTDDYELKEREKKDLQELLVDVVEANPKFAKMNPLWFFIFAILAVYIPKLTRAFRDRRKAAKDKVLDTAKNEQRAENLKDIVERVKDNLDKSEVENEDEKTKTKTVIIVPTDETENERRNRIRRERYALNKKKGKR